MKPCENVSCWIAPELGEKIREIARDNRCSVSAILRIALTNHVQKTEEATDLTRKAKNEPD